MAMFVSGSSTSTGSFGSAHIADKVGIGTTAPNAPLNLNTTTTQAFTITGATTGYSYGRVSNTGGGNMVWGVEGSSAGAMITGDTAYSGYIGSVVAKDFHLATTGIARLSIASGGNVGIGISAPEGKLHIAQSAANIYGLDAYHSSGNTTSTAHIIWGNSGSSTKSVLRVHEEGTRSNLDTDVFLVTGTSSNTDLFHIRANGNATFAGTVVSSVAVESQLLKVLDGSTFCGGLFREETITGAGSSRDISLFAEGTTDGGAIHFMTGGSVTKVLTLDASNNATFDGQIIFYGGGQSPDIDTTSGGLHLSSVGGDVYLYDGATAHDFYIYNAGTNKIKLASNGDSYFNGGDVGIGQSSPSAILHILKNSGASNVVELLRLDCSETAHATAKGGKIVFRDIDVYEDTAAIEAQRQGLSASSTFRIKLRNGSSYFALLSDDTSYNAANSSSWNTSSDERIKKNIQSFNGLEKVNALRPVTYDYKQAWINQKDPARTSKTGFIAQEYKEVFPDAVNQREITIDGTTYDDFHTMDSDDLLPYLVKAVQELSAKLEALENA